MVVLALLFLSGSPLAQSESETPSFEVVSVKPAEPPAPGRRLTPLGGGPGTKSPARYAGVASMKTMLALAYGVKGYQITGPAWMDSERYEIVAKLPPGATKEDLPPMLRRMLLERFHVAVHRETKELPMYALLVGKNGPKLEESDPATSVDPADAAAEATAMPRPRVTMGADGFPQIPADAKIPGSFTLSLASGQFTRTKWFARHQTADELADTIAGYVGRPVKNLTGLTGPYDFTLAFESDPSVPSGAAPTDPGPSIFAAVQEQLGLRLEQRKGPVDMLIVHRLEKVPTEN